MKLKLAVFFLLLNVGIGFSSSTDPSIGIFNFKQIDGITWSVVLEDESITIRENSGLSAYVGYTKTDNTNEKVKEIIKSFTDNHSASGATQESDSTIELENNKFQKIVLKTDNEKAFLYILVHKKHVLSIDTIVTNESISLIGDLEKLLAKIKISEPVVNVQPQPTPQPTPPTTQTPHSPPRYTAPQDGMSPPQRVQINGQKPIKDTSLFTQTIYSDNYKIKLGMSYDEVTDILKNEPIKSLTKEMIREMLIYKFKLQKNEKPWIKKYSETVSKLSTLSVISLTYKDKMLILFFYKQSLYSIKLREEGVTLRDFDLNIGVLTRVLSYSESGILKTTKYGRQFLIKKNGNIYLSYQSYAYDTSAEMTLYKINIAKKIERAISRKMYGRRIRRSRRYYRRRRYRRRRR